MKRATLAALAVTGLASAGAVLLLSNAGDRASLLDSRSRILGLSADAAAAKAIDPAARGLAREAAARDVRIVLPMPVPGTASLSLPARTAPMEQAVISSRTSGLVAERFFDIGDQVNAGDLLLRIEAPEIEQELLRANAAIAQAESRVRLADLEFQRAESLVPKGHVSVQTKDQRYAAKLSAQADLAAARAEAKRLEEIVSFQEVRAPFSGTIVERRVDRGDKVAAAQSQADGYLFRIARMEELRVEVDVPQSEAVKVTAGAPARLAFSEFPGEPFSANVVRAAKFIDRASGTMRIELVMKNSDLRIPAGLNGEAVIEIAESSGAVLIPNNTILARQGRQVVAVVDGEDRVRIKPVRVARDLGDRVIVSSGLQTADRVIVSPNAMLKEGDTVKVHALAVSDAGS